MTTASERLWKVMALLGAALLGGCSSNELTVAVTAPAEANGGRPFYAVVRAVDQGTHFTDTYESIAAKVFANPADPSVLGAEVIYPGKESELVVPRPEGTPVGIYFLFTSPGERWKVLKPQPLGDTVQVELGPAGVVATD